MKSFIFKNMRSYLYLFLANLLQLISCYDSKDLGTTDLIIHNAIIYSAESLDTQPFNGAIAISEGRIKALGTNEDILKLKTSETQVKDAAGQFLMPGFIEGHGHFSGMGETLQNLNFLTDTSWQQIVKKVEDKVCNLKPGEWIYGRGWHQEKWDIEPDDLYEGYPTHNTLSKISPDNPVILVHASGHSLFANEKAMELAGISSESPDTVGGTIIKDQLKNPIGVFEENSMDHIKLAFNAHKKSLDEKAQTALWHEAIQLAQKKCLENGITSFQDAGSKFYELDRYEQLAKDGKMDIRLWAMVRHSSQELKNKVGQYRKIDIGNGHFTCRAIKTEVDGALGAHGAWLLEPYSDKPGFIGQNTTEISEVAKIAELANKHDMQLCVHAIGDRANKEVLDIIENHKDTIKSKRWRIEHAQHLNPTDIMRFKSTGAIASMQGVHCTSDAPFVVKRLGMLRAKVGAYAWKALLNQGVTIVNGTDVPVEDIDPIRNFYASVTRTRVDNGMKFFVTNRMSRVQALRSYTLDAAYGAFEEKKKGSLEVGKYADLVMLSKNLLTCGDQEILKAKVLMTMVGGEVKYENFE